MRPHSTIRPVDEHDLSAISTIDQATNPHPWSLSLLQDSLREHAGWVVLCHQEAIAFLLFANRIDHCDLLLLATLPQYQRQHHAKRLLDTLMAYNKQYGLTRIVLEVRESNKPALAFYHTMGFTKVGERKNYYVSPMENAFILEKPC